MTTTITRLDAPSMPPEFSISILTYTALSFAKQCVESVLAHRGKHTIELLLTDNGGAPEVGSFFESVAANAPEGVTVRVFHNASNQGFISPNRHAFSQATGKYFILLNDDTTVTPNWLDLLIAPFATDPKCIMTGPAGGCCQLRSDFTGEGGPRFEYLEGAMLCMDHARVASIEPTLFPEELVGAYGEDSYISLRCREAGYNLHRVAIQFKHHRCATSQLVPKCREWQQHNHAFLKQRFREYIVAHRFDYPTIIRRNAAWGDVLLTTAVIRGLKSLRPMSPIYVETICPDVFNGNPDVAHVGRNIARVLDAVDINLNGISEMHCDQPILDAYAECAGIELDGETTAIYPPGGDVEWARRTVTGEWIAVHAGPTSWRCKNWPTERWIELIGWLRESRKVVMVGSDPQPLQLKADLDLRGKTTVGQLAAILGEVRLLVGVDSFPIHVAQAMKTPVVGLFGITRPELILTSGSLWTAATAPEDHPAYGLRHKSPGKTHVDHPQNPMDAITVEQVQDAIKTILS